jgi:hypothetical protein
MKYAKELGVLLVALLILGSITVPLFIEKTTDLRQLDKITSNEIAVFESHDMLDRQDLTEVEGADVLGMVLLAVDGKYDLILDGILITENSDLDFVNLSGVSDQMYKIEINYLNSKETVIAKVVR